MSIEYIPNLVINSRVESKHLAWTVAKQGRQTTAVERSTVGDFCPNVAHFGPLEGRWTETVPCRQQLAGIRFPQEWRCDQSGGSSPHGHRRDLPQLLLGRPAGRLDRQAIQDRRDMRRRLERQPFFLP
jgi:hypothetical protein